MKQHAFGELENRLYEVSDPDHSEYGKHLDTSEVHSLIAPNDDTWVAVHDWLAASNVKDISYSPAGDWIFVPMTVGDAEKLLDTEYHLYAHEDTGDELVRTPQYGLPRSLHEHVDMVAPTNYFGDVQAMKRTLKVADSHGIPYGSGVPPGFPWHRPSSGPPGGYLPPSQANLSTVCNSSAVTNLCLRTLYKTVNYAPQVPQTNYVAMTAYLNETANISDFHIFLSQQRKDASLDYTFNYTSINDGIDYQGLEPPEYFDVRDLEANLDSQTIGGFVYPTQFRVYSTGGSPPFIPDLLTPTDTNEPYLDWLSYMLSLSPDELPKTISTSYGDNEQTIPVNYALRACQEFAQLGARGTSLLFSSGDNGVGANGTCLSNDGQNKTEFTPAFPASCPYVTTVGATRNFQPEIVAYDVRNGYVSGSGFSNLFARPSYQENAVKSYLSSIGSLHQGLYNASGRAYPDIAAQGYHFVIVYGGANILLDGTSCAAPTATSVLTLVNDALIAKGKPALGFLNPWLYKYGYRGFNDITMGSAWGCNT